MTIKICTILSIIYLSAILLFSIFNAIYNFRLSRRQLSILLTVFVVSCSFVAYCITPTGEGPDIVRYYSYMAEMQNMDFITAMTKTKYSSTIVANLLFFVVAQIGDFDLIKVVSTLVTVGCMSYIVYETAFYYKNRYTNYIMPFILFLFSGYNFITIFTGIRQPIAMSIILVALFRDLYLNKIDCSTIILYITSFLVHTQVIVLIFIRVLSIFKFRKLNYFIVLIPILAGLILPYFNGINSLLDLVIDKYFIYINYPYDNRWVFMYQITKFILYSSVIWILLNKGIASCFLNKNKIKVFWNNYILFSIASIQIEHLFVRYLKVINVLMIPLIYVYFNNMYKEHQIYNIVRKGNNLTIEHLYGNNNIVLFILLACFVVFDCALQVASFNGWILNF